MNTFSQGITLDQFDGENGGMQEYLRLLSAPMGSLEKLVDVLSCLNKALSPTRSFESMLATVAALTRQAMSVDICAISLLDPATNSLVLRATDPDILKSHQVIVSPVSLDPSLWEKLLKFRAYERLPVLDTQEQERLNPLINVHFENLLPMPLAVDAQCLGLLNCYSSKHRDFTPGDGVVLHTIANQVSLAIQNRQLAQSLPAADSVKIFFDDLLSEVPPLEESLRGRAIALGCDPSGKHALAVLELCQEALPPTSSPASPLADTTEVDVPPADDLLPRYKTALQMVKECLLANYPRSLVDERENVLYTIISLEQDHAAAHLTKLLTDLGEALLSDYQMQLFAGIGSICDQVSAYRHAFMEAKEALYIGQYLPQHSGCMHFKDLGAYRYVFPFATTIANPLVDRYQEKVAALAYYDARHKRSGLLDTLQTFLDVSCNIKEAADRLNVHRNTLLKRVERIQELCAIDLDNFACRLPLHVAILVYRLGVHAPLARTP